MHLTRRARGFTLIEIMIVLVILGVLTAIALPLYQDSVRKARRTEAKSDLMELASRQERFYAANSSYTADIEGEAGLDWEPPDPDEGEVAYYDLSARGCNDPADLSTCYIMTARVKAGTDQVKDERCVALAVNSLGEQLAVTSEFQNSSAECW